jgi:hypothetical protein
LRAIHDEACTVDYTLGADGCPESVSFTDRFRQARGVDLVDAGRLPPVASWQAYEAELLAQFRWNDGAEWQASPPAHRCR